MNESNESDEWIRKTSLEDFVKLKINNPEASLDEKDFYKKILKELKPNKSKIINNIYEELVCPICGDIIEWVLEPDPDSLHYKCTHKECELYFTLYPIKFNFSTEKLEDENAM